LNVDPAPHATSLPSIFTDHGWSILNTSIISTSNCGNPALRLFGFGPVAADGYGIGYIIKDDGISVYVTFNTQMVQLNSSHLYSCASSKHLQTRRFLDTLKQYFHDVQRMIIQLHRQANERPRPLEPSSPKSPKHHRKPSRGNPDEPLSMSGGKKIVVKRAGSQVLVAPNGETDEEGQHWDLDLLSALMSVWFSASNFADEIILQLLAIPSLIPYVKFFACLIGIATDWTVHNRVMLKFSILRDVVRLSVRNPFPFSNI
jgi:hypothetical protein